MYHENLGKIYTQWNAIIGVAEYWYLDMLSVMLYTLLTVLVANGKRQLI